MSRKFALAGLATNLVVLLTATTAFANGGVAMAVDVANSRQTIVDSSSGVCTWEVGSSATVINITSQTQTLNSVGYSVSWTATGASGVQNSITVLNSGGLVAGVSLAPDERRTFSPVELRFSIPCQADFGDLAIRVTSNVGTGSGDAPFLEGGTPVPPGAVGVSILAVVLGIQLVVSHRRRTTPALARARR